MKVLGLHRGPAGIWRYRIASQMGDWATYDEHDASDWFNHAMRNKPDVVITSYSGGLELLAELCAFRESTGIPFVIDCDDFFLEIPEYNDAHNIVHPASPAYKILVAMLREASAVTCTQPTLARLLHEHVGITAHIVPNFVKPEWFKAEKRVKPSDQIRIVFTGASAGRWGDLELIRPVIQEVTEDKRLEVCLFGPFPSWALEIDNVRAIRWASNDVYYGLLNHLNFDIGLAPLLNNSFNRCKSGIKYYEYAMVGAAGVYSALDPYNEVVDGVTGLIVPNDEYCWLDAIDRLVTSVDLRRRICDNAYADVRDSHTSSGALAVVLNEVINGHSTIVGIEAEVS